MSKSFRYDPRDDGGEYTRPSKKELKRQRKERHKRGESLDQHMERDDDV
jgi:hypothetical protein